jgi:hypothetical protein
MRPSGSVAHQRCSAGVVAIMGNRPVFDTRNGFINDKQGHQKPFLGLNRVTEAVFDRDVQSGRGKQAVKQVFHSAAVDAGQFVGRHHIQ